MKALLTLIMFTIICNLHGQNTFQKKLKGNASTFGIDIITDNNDGYNIIGNTTINDSSFIFNSRLNLAGNVVWSKLFCSTDKSFSTKLIQLTYGRMIIGYTQSSNDTIKGLVIKTDNDGNIIWSRTYKSGKIIKFNDALPLADKSCIIIGVNDSLGINSNVFVTKIDSMGQEIFAKTYSGSGEEYGNSIMQSSDGNLVIAGYSNTSDPLGDILVVKIDISGNVLWSKLYDININSYRKQCGYGITENHLGKILVCGSSENYYFGPGDEAWGPVILWVEQNGNFIKMKHYSINSGKNAALRIKELNNYGYIYTGKLFASPHILAVELDSSGTALWSKYYPALGAFGTSNSSIILNQSEFITIGNYYSSIDTSVYIVKTLNQGASGCYELTTSHDTSTYPTTVSNINFIVHNLSGLSQLIQINISNQNLTDSAFCSHIVTGILENNVSTENILLYPVPAYDNIVVESPAISKNTLISIFNIQGQLLLNQSLTQEKVEIDISSFSKGMYFLKVNTDKGMEIKKFIKE